MISLTFPDTARLPHRNHLVVTNLKDHMTTYIAYAIACAFPLILIGVFIADAIADKRKTKLQDARLERAIENALLNASRKRQVELHRQHQADMARLYRDHQTNRSGQ